VPGVEEAVDATGAEVDRQAEAFQSAVTLVLSPALYWRLER